MKQRLLNIFDRLTMEIFGQSYRWRRAQRKMLARIAERERIRDRVARMVGEKLRADLNAPDEAGW